MNLPLLILPALAATLALSAAKTLPADLRHDTRGKAPLTVARMAVARGAGSTCRLGCNEPNTDCEVAYGGNGSDPMIYLFGQDWNPHNECAFAMGSDTCLSKGRVLCYSNYYYDYAPSGCTVPPYRSESHYTPACLTVVPI